LWKTRLGIGYGPAARLTVLKKQYAVNMHYRMGVTHVTGQVRPLFRQCTYGKTVTLILTWAPKEALHQDWLAGR